MPSEYIGRKRSQSLYRLIGLVYIVTIWPIVATVGMAGGLVALLLDVLMGLLFDSDADGMLSRLGERLLYWPLNQLTWVFVHDPDSFQWLP